MSRRLLAVVLTVLVIVAAAAVLLPHAASSNASARPAAAATVTGSNPSAYLEYELTNGFGYYAGNSYYIGELGWDTLTFWVYDPFDTSVNFTLTDPNATRDGVGNPAFHVEVTLNSTSNEYYSAPAGVEYTFPDLATGGTWNVNFSAPAAGSYTENITLHKYYVEASSSVTNGQSALPGESYSIFWWAYLQSNGYSLYTGATSVSAVGHYWGNGTWQNLFPGGIESLTVGSWGQWSATIPANATGGESIEIEIWVTTTVGGVVAENESTYVYVDVGTLWLYSNGITIYPGDGCLGNYYYDIPVGTEAAACIEVGSDWYDEFTPVAGLPVTISYWNGTQNVTPVAAPSSATTDAYGDAIVLFNASAPFINYLQSPYYDSVNFTVTVPGAYSSVEQWTTWANLTWVISPFPYASGIVNVALDHTQYYDGATATVTWSIDSSDTAVTGAVTAVNWYLENDYYGLVYASGTLSGSVQSGTFTFPITSVMVGQSIVVYVDAANATEGFEGYASAEVVTPTLLLTPSSGYFTEGSTVSVTAVLSGSATPPAGTTISWTAYGEYAGDENEAALASGTVANGGSLSVPISSTSPPQYVWVDAYASAAGQVLAGNEVETALETGYSVLLGVGTASSYTDGSYQPGQTVTLNYEVVPIDGTAMPQTFSFELYAESFPYAQYIQNVAPSGSLSFTIPSDAKAGLLVLDLEVDSSGLTAGECQPYGECSAVTGLLINPSPSVLSMELGAGSGLTVGWVILLVIVLLVAIVLFVVLRRRGGSKGPSSSGMNPPAPAPTTPPATAWQEPPSPGASGSQPPLPPPTGSS